MISFLSCLLGSELHHRKKILGSGLAERILSDGFEDDSIELVPPIVEPKLALLEV